MSVPAAGYVPPSGPLRTKRNFKALVLSDDPSDDLQPVATRPAPAGPGGPKKRPPPLGDDSPANGLRAGPPPGAAFLPRSHLDSIPVDSPATGRRSAMLDKLAKLDLKTKINGAAGKGGTRLDLKKEDLNKLADLGQGNGGSVEKVEHTPTGTIMAKKVRFTCHFEISSVY